MTSSLLQNHNVLITRPLEQAKGLANAVEQHSGNAVVFPLIEIVEPRNNADLKHAMDNLTQCGLLIFVSVNAVNGFINALETHGISVISISPGTKVAVIGESTKRYCESLGIVVDYCPSEQMNSEGLIECLAKRDWTDVNVQIYRGQSGRELLTTLLEAQGARVETVESYQRQYKSDHGESISRIWRSQQINCIVLTSVSILHALENLFENADMSLLGRAHAIVFSQRIARECQSLPFKSITVTKTPSDQGVIESLINIGQRL